MTRIQTFTKNDLGRDFAVGDIHGYFSRLSVALDSVGFDPAADRLFAVGDLVDRGPECNQVLDWLAKPWFHSVQGNHDDMARRWPNGRMEWDTYRANGGAWNMDQPRDLQEAVARAMAALPVAIEVETAGGVVGIVHADVPYREWDYFAVVLAGAYGKSEARHATDMAMWSRERIKSGSHATVNGILAVVVGHTTLPDPVTLGNVYHIDTGGWLPEGHFTLLDLARLQPIAARRGLDLSDLGAESTQHD